MSFMKHLIICPEYPPAPIPPGGIGTYVLHISRLLAESGENVHVIGQLWEGATKTIEEKCNGRLIIHRVAIDDWESLDHNPISEIRSKGVKGLFQSSFPPQCFSWQAGLLAENLIEREGIDVIEAQDYEAPLYYFQLRRALGMGPKKRPPCIVHLHSPTDIIVRYNDWDINHIYFRTAKRLEDYSVAAADALLCPSRVLAGHVESYYGLAEGNIRIIPLPIGDTPILERDKDTWEHGTICYIGRLQPLKGVIEWIDAVVEVATEYPNSRFEFIGTNCLGTDNMSGEEFLERRIPKQLVTRFLFHGEQKRSSLAHFLARARIAVVPSRWENFPNTCIEMMSSGLPVIASGNGGLTEIIEDGRTGWQASKPGSQGLSEALKRALDTPSMKIAEMGHEASIAIRRICDNGKIVEAHLDFRSQVVNQGSKHSLHLPVNLPWTKRHFSDGSLPRDPKNSSQEGLALVVTCLDAGQSLDECLQRLKQQTRKPAAVVIVDGESSEEQTLMAMEQALREGWKVIRNRNGGLVSAKNAAIEAVLDSGSNPIGFAFLSAEDQLEPGFVAAYESVLQQCPEVGLVSCWVHHLGTDDRIWIRPCPSFPYQWLSNEAAPFSAIRTEALCGAGNFRPVMSEGYEDWDLFNAVMAAGWVAVTIPEILAHNRVGKGPTSHFASIHEHVRMRRELLERFPDLIARDANDILLLSESNTAQLMHEEPSIPPKQIAIARMMLRYPRGAVLRALRKVKIRVIQRTPVWMSNFFSRMTI